MLLSCTPVYVMTQYIFHLVFLSSVLVYYRFVCTFRTKDVKYNLLIRCPIKFSVHKLNYSHGKRELDYQTSTHTRKLIVFNHSATRVPACIAHSYTLYAYITMLTKWTNNILQFDTFFIFHILLPIAQHIKYKSYAQIRNWIMSFM